MPSRGARICGCGRTVAFGRDCICQRGRKADADNRRPSARERGYDSRWDKARATYLATHPLCVMRLSNATCGKPATIVDHVVPHRGDQKKFWDSSNWQSLCVHCHSARKQTSENRGSYDAQRRSLPFDVKRSRIPVVIVCGPPGSGKSTYVRQNAGPNDLRIDLDEIRSQLAKVPLHSPAPEFTAAALDERNRILRSLASDYEHECAWFIISAPSADERSAWREKLGASRVVLLDVPLAECRRRIWLDPERVGQQQRMEDLARKWWQRYSADQAPHDGGSDTCDAGRYRVLV